MSNTNATLTDTKTTRLPNKAAASSSVRLAANTEYKKAPYQGHFCFESNKWSLMFKVSPRNTSNALLQYLRADRLYRSRCHKIGRRIANRKSQKDAVRLYRISRRGQRYLSQVVIRMIKLDAFVARGRHPKVVKKGLSDSLKAKVDQIFHRLS